MGEAMSCQEWTGAGLCGAPAVWRFICHSGGGERLLCSVHVVQMVARELTCEVELVSCG